MSDEPQEPMDWEKAESILRYHFILAEDIHFKCVVLPLERRYHVKNERTRELYDAIMALE